MATSPPERESSLGDSSPADLLDHSSRSSGRATRAKVVKEISLWVVAALSAGAGALGMQVGGGWDWSFLAFAVTLAVLLVVRAQVLRVLDNRTEAEKAAALAAERRAAEMAAQMRQEERSARRKEAGQRPHKPRSNPYRRRGA